MPEGMIKLRARSSSFIHSFIHPMNAYGAPSQGQALCKTLEIQWQIRHIACPQGSQGLEWESSQ